MNVMGIDPGQNGAIVIINDNYSIIEKYIPKILDNGMDLKDMSKWINSVIGVVDHIYLEKVHALFGSSAAGTFNFGRYYGNVEGLLSHSNLEFNRVPPKVWQQRIHQYLELGGYALADFPNAKLKSLKCCEILWPEQEQFYAPPRPRAKPYKHDGVIDAALIAYYGLLIQKEKL